jgi:hypothetical protein
MKENAAAAREQDFLNAMNNSAKPPIGAAGAIGKKN